MKKIIINVNGGVRATHVKKGNKKGNTIIILMAMPLPIHTITAVLDMPHGNLERGARAGDIQTACSGTGSLVTVPPTLLTELSTAITNYNTATPGTRNNLYRLLNNVLKQIMSLFQTAADGNPANAIAIIESGAFRVKQVAIPQQHEFKAENETESGSVMLTAKGGGKKAHCHDWMVSADGITFVRLMPSTSAEKLVDGLEVGKYAYFTHELILLDVPQGVSQIIRIMVK